MRETKVKRRSGSRIAFLIVALLVAKVGANAKEHPLLFLADPADGPFDGVRAAKHYNRGVDLQIKGDPEGAIVEYRTAISLRPNYPEAQSAIAEALKARGKS